MYNRYLNLTGRDPVPPALTEKAEEKPVEAENSRKGLFGTGLKLPELNTDTLLILVLVYFLITDDESAEDIGDTLLIIGALLLLGF